MTTMEISLEKLNLEFNKLCSASVIEMHVTTEESELSTACVKPYQQVTKTGKQIDILIKLVCKQFI